MSAQEYPSPAELLQRLTELECRIAFQEQTMQTLSNELAMQQQRNSELSTHLQLVYRQLRDLQDLKDSGLTDMPADERPPHY